LAYIFYDTTSGIIRHAQTAAPNPSDVPNGQAVVQVDDSLPNVSECYGNPTAYAWQNGAVVRRPYFTLVYTNKTVTATLNLPPATPPTQVTFTVCGQTYTAPLSNGQATLALDVHPSVASQQIVVTASAPGCYSGTLNIGGAAQQIGLQVYTPQSGIPTVASVGPGSRSFLAAYWSSASVNPAYTAADTATAVGLLEDAVFNVVLPALKQAGLITLTDNQTNFLADAQAAVTAKLLVTMETAAPKPTNGQPQSFDPRYAHYRAIKAAVQQAMLNYANDIATIPNLQ
jgi:hypothetical protein